MQIHGGFGYAEEYAVSRLFVDARVLSIFEGADETLCLKVIARRLVGSELSDSPRASGAGSARPHDHTAPDPFRSTRARHLARIGSPARPRRASIPEHHLGPADGRRPQASAASAGRARRAGHRGRR